MAPALMGCWIEDGAGFFLFGVIAWRRRRATGSIAAGTRGVDLRWGGSMSSSLSRFSGWRSRTLSLGEGLTDSTGARDGTRADGVLDRGRRRLFSFWRYCLAAPSSYRVDRGRHPGCRPSLGWINVELSLPIFRLARAVFVPWRGAGGLGRREGRDP